MAEPLRSFIFMQQKSACFKETHVKLCNSEIAYDGTDMEVKSIYNPVDQEYIFKRDNKAAGSAILIYFAIMGITELRRIYSP